MGSLQTWVAAHSSQVKLAKQLGTTQSAVHRWLKRKRLPRGGTLQRLSKITNLTLQEVLESVLPLDRGGK